MKASNLLFSGVLLAALVGCNPPASGPVDTAEAPEATAATAGHTFDEGDRWNLANSPIKGSTEALVTIVEFSEFQCPFCSRVLPTMNQILESEEFAGKVRIVFKHLPLGFHDRARPAAIASMAAGRQNKFWEFHDLAFANQRDLTDENFIAWATQLELDLDQFRADLADEELAAQVDADAALAGTMGISGTPNFMVNGRAVRGAQPFDNFANIIREEIAAMEAAIEGGQTPAQAYGARLDANATANAQNQPQRQQQRQARPTPDPNAELAVPVGESPIKGNPDALITIVEFSEFQCPFCTRVLPTLDQIVEEYGDQVRVVFKHNPLGFHDRAEPAARAAIAAQNQGKFWEFHDLAFANQRELTDENFAAWAEQLGLDVERFQADMQAEETTRRIQEDQALARRLSAGGTPHFFVNGYRLRGAQPFDAFKTMIDARLEEANALMAAEGVAASGVYAALQADAITGPAPMIQPPAGANNNNRPAEPEGPFEIDTDGFPFIGAADASVVMVEYSDFTCGYCRRFHGTIEEAIQGYEDRVKVVFKQFPRNAPDLAIAAIAAHRQGKFVEFRDAIFDENARSAEQAAAIAERLGLDMGQYNSDVANDELRQQAMSQRSEGQRFGVRGTPTWFVNGMRHVGARDVAAVRATWDAALND